jgi:hypothetical protein
MVMMVREGNSMRATARQCGVSLATVRYWVARADRKVLEEVDWADRCRAPHRTRRVALGLEETILAIRESLKTEGSLGEFGALAIHRDLKGRSMPLVPSVRTIGRILLRRGVLDGRRRIRRPAPPPGWHLPAVVAGQAELDSFDIVEDLVIEGHGGVQILNGISLHGGLAESWPREGITTKIAVESILGHWRRFGLPGYAQFDNDTRFQGAHNHPDVVGRFSRICLSLGVVPVFAPPRETGFQAAIESFNGLWQAKVWQRFHHDDLGQLQERSSRYTQAHHLRNSARIGSAPARAKFPEDWKPDLQAFPQGTIIYLRRTTDAGRVCFLGHHFDIDRRWPHRLVRAEVDLTNKRIRFFALRRRDPSDQPLLKEVRYALPQRLFDQ